MRTHVFGKITLLFGFGLFFASLLPAATEEISADITEARTLTGENTFTLTQDVTDTGVLSGAGSLRVDGGHTLTVNVVNSFSGGLTVGPGTVKVINSATSADSGIGAAGNLITVENGGTLSFLPPSGVSRTAGYHAGNVVIQDGGTIQSNDGDFNFATGHTVTMYGTASVTGSGFWRFRDGAVNLVVGGQDGTNANAVISISNFEIRNITNAPIRVGNAGDVLTISSVIREDSAGRGITKTGAGTLVLSGVNTFTGTLAVNQGTVDVRRGTNGISTSANITVGTAEGTAAKLKLAGKALGDHTGTVKIYQGGTIEIAGTDTSIGNNKGIEFIGGGTISASNGGYFYLRGNDDGRQTLKVTGANAHALISGNMKILNTQSTIDVQDATSDLTFSYIIGTLTGFTAGLTKIGDGTLNINTEIRANGAFIVGKAAADPATMLNGGTVKLTGASQLTSYILNKGTFEITGGGSILSSASVQVNKDGVLFWNKSNAFNNSLSGSGLVKIASGTTSNFNPSSTDYSAFTGRIELSGNTRFCAGNVNLGTVKNASTIQVQSGTEFWTNSGSSFYSRLELAGTGANAGGDTTGRGAIRVDYADCNFYGDIFLNENALIGSASAHTGTFYGNIDTNGKTLTMGVTVTSGGTLVVAGDLTSSASSRGSLVTQNNDFTLKIGNPTDSETASVQNIDVPITYGKPENALIFASGKNRTVALTQAVTGTAAAVRVASGTLHLKDSGALNVASVEVAEGAKLIVDTAAPALPANFVLHGDLAGSGALPTGIAPLASSVISPGNGNTLGTLTVNGDYTQNNQGSTGFLEIHALKNAASFTGSSLHVAGNADLTGAVIKLVAVSDSAGVEMHDYIDLITAESFTDTALASIDFSSTMPAQYVDPAWALSLVKLENDLYALRATALNGEYLPEPGTAVLLFLGIAGGMVFYRRKNTRLAH